MVREFDLRKCECGCEEMYRPTRDFQKFVDGQHRQAFHNNMRWTIKKAMEALGPEGVQKVLQGTY